MKVCQHLLQLVVHIFWVHQSSISKIKLTSQKDRRSWLQRKVTGQELHFHLLTQQRIQIEQVQNKQVFMLKVWYACFLCILSWHINSILKQHHCDSCNSTVVSTTHQSLCKTTKECKSRSSFFYSLTHRLPFSSQACQISKGSSWTLVSQPDAQLFN